MKSKYLFGTVLIFIAAFAEAKIFHVSQDGRVDGLHEVFPTIGSAAALAQPGDTILVHGGTYRERIAPPRGGEEGRPITYMAVPGEDVIVKGSDVWKPEWVKVGGQKNIYFAVLDRQMFTTFNPFSRKIQMFELMASSSFYKNAENSEKDAANNTLKDIKVTADNKYTLGQLFVDGKMLTEVLSEDEVVQQVDSWVYVESENKIVASFDESLDPRDALIEITTRNRIFAPHIRGLGYINVKGFVFEHCANDAIVLPHMVEGDVDLCTGQQGAVSTRSGHHWVIEGNVIRFSKTVGLDVGSETNVETLMDYESKQYRTPLWENVGYHLIKNNVVSDNGIAGILAIKSNNLDILDNIVERNNLLLYTGHQHAAIKVLLTPNCRVEGNVVQDNESIGIWLDNQVNHSTIINNFVYNNRRAGVFYELSKGPVLIEKNVIGGTRRDFFRPLGSGLLLSDASGITVKNNIVYDNDDFGLRLRLIPGRKGEWSVSGFTELKDIEIENNIFSNNALGGVEMPYWGELVGRINFKSNFYRGKDLFALTTIGQLVQSGETDYDERNRVIGEYEKAFGKAPKILNENEGPLRWSIALDFEEWKEFLQLDIDGVTP